jgi:hypothetical protein
MSVRGQSLGMGEGGPGTRDQDVSWWMDSHGVAVFARPLIEPDEVVDKHRVGC